MRKISKFAAAAAALFAGWAAAAHAQPLIAGNVAAFGCGPIQTNDYTLGKVVASFIPTGAGPTPCVIPPNNNNGRGLAVGGQEIFYTELVDNQQSPPAFGPTDLIRVATFNSGAGSADTRSLPNPRPGAGIQDLTFSNGTLFALTGYETDPPWVYGLNLVTGAVLSGPIVLAGSTAPVIPLPAGTDSDGFAILPNGHFLINNGDTSCIYNEYDNVTGQLVPTGTINVPGGPTYCTGVDTDGTSLYFLTDFNSITQSDLTGQMTGYTFWDNPGGSDEVEDISLVHPVTVITDVEPAGLYFTISNTDDINTNFDIQAELLLNGDVIGGGIARCVPTAGPPGTFIPRNIPGHAVSVPIEFPPYQLLVSGDVLSMRVSARIGTNADDSSCGGHVSAVGLRFFYDSVADPSQVAITINPDPTQTLYFHSNGTTCVNALGESSGVTARTLSNVAPNAASPRCKEVGAMSRNNGNPWTYFSTWSLAAIP